MMTIWECDRCGNNGAFYHVKIDQADFDGDTSDPTYANLCPNCFHEISIGFLTRKEDKESSYSSAKDRARYKSIGQSKRIDASE